MDELFQIFNPDWWMNDNNSAFQIADAVLFLLFSIPVAYIFIYALASLPKYKNPYPPAPIQHRFLILYVVLKNGQEVIESINNFLDMQLYPKDLYDIVVAATQLPEEDLCELLSMPVNIVVPDKENCTKVYAIQQVMQRYSPEEYDTILIFNSDNKIIPNALELFNNAYYSGCDAIQGHRMAENLTTDIAVLNATSEEINNRLFRKAHTTLGFSSALIGSGLMLDFEMFHRIAPRLKGSDLTTSLEMELLKENIYTEYLEEVICYCKKTTDAAGYSEERQRWLSAQYHSTLVAFLRFPIALIQGKWDLCEKLFQWLMPSRFLLIVYITLCTLVMTVANWPLSLKWYGLLGVLFFSFLMALPDGEITHRFRKAFWSLPILIFTSAFSHFLRFKKQRAQKKKKKGLNENKITSENASMDMMPSEEQLAEGERV